jgi:hypothetical protein
VTSERLRQRIKERLEADEEGAVEIFELSPPASDGRRTVSFYRNRGGESRRWQATIRVGPNDEVTECGEPSPAVG